MLKYVAISAAWSMIAWLGTANMPLGEFAKHFSRDVPDAAWFATVVPSLTRLARIGLSLAPWLALAVISVIRLFRRHFAAIDRMKTFAGVVIAMALLSFPPPISASATGLDQSWQWYLNHVAFTGAFGRDVVFTYGPLGFLLMPQIHLSNALAALAANLFFLGSWSFCLLSLFRIGEGGRKAAWLLLVTMFFPQNNMEWRWVALATLSVAVPLVRTLLKSRPNVFVDAALAALGGIALAIASLMKFSSLVTIAGTQVFTLGVTAFLLRGRTRLMPPIAWFVSFAAVFSCLSALSFDSVGTFVTWAKGSLAIADGYNKYFISAKSVTQLLLMPALLCVGGALLFLRTRSTRAKLALLLAFSPLIFCTLKYGWTRQGPEAFCYLFCMMLSVATALSPNIAPRVFYFTSAIVALSVALLVPRLVIGSRTCDFAFGVYPSGVVRTLTLGHSAEQARIKTEKNVAETRLPLKWLSRIKGKRVQFMPFDFSPAFGNDDFTMHPVPVLQLYSAYLPELDQMCAAAYDGPNSPDYIVTTRDAYWNGHFIKHPQTWRKVLSHYRFVASTDKHILLQRGKPESPTDTAGGDPRAPRNGPPEGQPLPIEHTVEVHCGEWVDCANWSSMAISEWRQTTWGKLCTTFFRNTMTYLSLRYADGSEERIEMNPSTMVHPWSLDRIALNPEDVDHILSGGTTRKPVAIRFEVTTQGIYQNTLTLNVQSIGK